MPSEVATFSVVTESIRRVAKTLHTQESEVTLRGKGKAPLGLLFISGRLIERSNQLAELVAHESCCHWLIIPVAGVLHHESEHDNDSAAAGVLFTKNQPKVFLANDLGPDLGDALIDEFNAKPVSSSLVLQRGTPDLDGWLGTLREATAANTPLIWGGGTHPRAPLLYVTPQEPATEAEFAAISFSRHRRTQLMTSNACRRLAPFQQVTKARGKLLLELEGQDALQALSEAAEGLQDQLPILLAVSAIPDASGLENVEQEDFALQPITGVDPSRGGLLLASELEEGTYVSFAVKDSFSARQHLEKELERLSREGAGAAPLLGIYVNCAGRARSLYAASSVDSRMIRKHLGNLPLIGFNSTFEICPLGESLHPRIYAGVLGIFSAPS